jgi:Holliday junction resolvase-like predicted endonuclease
MGEIDLLAWEGRTLVIVEVKYRFKQRGWPLSRVQAGRLRRAAQWLITRQKLAQGIRIDLIEVNRGYLPFLPTLNHLRAAVTMEAE